MKFFVTGGTGFIGSHVVENAISAGHEVIALRREGSAARIPLPSEPCWVEGNLEADLSASLAGCDALIHLAAHGVNPKLDLWPECFRWNVTASIGLWRRAAELGVRRFVIIGSCFEYGKSGERYEFIPTTAPLQPISAYAASKASATMAALALAVDQQLEVAVLRPFHTFGEGEEEARFWPQLRAAALAGADFPMTEGAQVRDFTPAAEIARQTVALAGHRLDPGSPVIYNLGSGVPRSILSFAQEWWSHWSAKGRLLPGKVPYRKNEIMRYVPQVSAIA